MNAREVGVESGGGWVSRVYSSASGRSWVLDYRNVWERKTREKEKSQWFYYYYYFLDNHCIAFQKEIQLNRETVGERFCGFTLQNGEEKWLWIRDAPTTVLKKLWMILLDKVHSEKHFPVDTTLSLSLFEAYSKPRNKVGKNLGKRLHCPGFHVSSLFEFQLILLMVFRETRSVGS